MKNEDQQKETSLKFKKLLANYLGVEVEDIDESDSLEDDLHMRATDLTDFLEILNQEGYRTDEIDLTEIDTVGELIESLGY